MLQESRVLNCSSPGRLDSHVFCVPSIVRTPHALIAYAECRMVIGDGCIPDSAVPLPR